MKYECISYSHGHKIYSKGVNWYYLDTDELHDNKKPRPCPRCGNYPTKEGYDACVGHIDGMKSVCCGHGVHERILMEE